MCVIVIVSKDADRPSEDMVEQMWQKNPDGGGIAYREGRGAERHVVWEKGLMGKETGLLRMKELIKTVPTPYVAHFRIASRGGVRSELTHPFPVEKDTSLALTGTTRGEVLFHNGDWKEWEDWSRSAAVQSNTRIPTGKWSDTRGMAWLCSIYGLGFMEFLSGQKGVAFGPKTLEVFGNGWKIIDNVYCSNDFFLPAVTTTFTPNQSTYAAGYCSYSNCTKRDNLDADHRCTGHPLASFPFHHASTNAPQSGNKAVVGTTGSTGGDSAAHPFLKSPKPIYGMELIERLFKMGKLSKKKYNKFKEGHRALALVKRQNQRQNAIERLEKLTASVSAQINWKSIGGQPT